MTATRSAAHRPRISFARICKHGFLLVASLVSVFPFYWMIVSSTNPTTDVILGRLLPGSFLFENFKSLSASGQLYRAFFNSTWYTLVITAVSLLISSLAGYGFITYQDRGKKVVMSLLLLSMMVPAAATLIPLFRFFSQLGLVNSPFGYMLPAFATTFLVFMFRQSSESFPQELVHAARIDGLGEFNIFFRVFVPIMQPTYAAAATITFMNTWNAYLWPLVILQSPKSMTVPIFVALLQTGYVMDYGMIMLGVTLATLPTLIVFFALQKSFVEGILGSLK
ncbi:MAG: carbohydrate ABC transporter permease [Clostridia bacterium]|nr:carbohydrate ABC transporter permease [Clostridia bacterium]